MVRTARKPLLRPRRRPGLVQRLRADFLTGLVVVVPAALTVALVAWAIGVVDSHVMPLLPGHPPFEQVAGFGVLVFVVVATAAGAFARGYAGRRALPWVEGVLARVPVVRSIHTALKQIVEAIVQRDEPPFRQICLIEYPERGIWTIAFVAGDAGGGLPDRSGAPDLTAVLVPTTPNPVTGFLVYARRADLRLLDLSAEDAAKLVMSAGLVSGDAPPVAPAPGNRRPRRPAA
jgi:uncharacterized membrane protein